MSSGVYRLRLARRGGGMNPIQANAQKTTPHSVDRIKDTLKVPKKPDKEVFAKFPTTRPPTGNESPSRGEHSAAH